MFNKIKDLPIFEKIFRVFTENTAVSSFFLSPSSLQPFSLTLTPPL